MYSLVFNQSKKLIRIIKTALCIYLDESFTINFTKNKTDSGVENGVSRVHTTHSEWVESKMSDSLWTLSTASCNFSFDHEV